jgi:hypothetical protein
LDKYKSLCLLFCCFSLTSAHFIDIKPFVFFFSVKITTETQLNSDHTVTVEVVPTKLLDNTIDNQHTTEEAASTKTNDKMETGNTEVLVLTTSRIYDQTTNTPFSSKHTNVMLRSQQPTNQQGVTLTMSESVTIKMEPYNTVMLTTKLLHSTTNVGSQYRSVTKENILVNKLLAQLTNVTVKQATLTTVEDTDTYTADYNYVESSDQILHDFFNFNWRLASM